VLAAACTLPRGAGQTGEGITTVEGQGPTEFWSPPMLRHLVQDSDQTVYAVAFSHAHNMFATGSSDKACRFYSFNGEKKPELTYILREAKDYVNAVGFSHDGRWLATGSLDKQVRLYKIGTDKNGRPEPVLKHTLKDARDFIWVVTFSYDGKWFATGSSDKNIRVYSVDGDEEHPDPILRFTLQSIRSDRPFWDQSDALYTVSFSFDGNWLAAGSSDKHVRVYNIDGDDKPVLRATLKHATAPVYAVTFSYDGRWLATGSSDEKARLYSLEGCLENDEEPKLMFTMRDFQGPVRSITFSYDSKRLAIASLDRQVRLYAVDGAAKPVLKHRIGTGDDSIWSVAWSYDNLWLATGCANKTARIYQFGGDGNMSWQRKQPTLPESEMVPDLAEVVSPRDARRIPPAAAALGAFALAAASSGIALAALGRVRRSYYQLGAPLLERLRS
jgi:WD40 repeat protein